MDVKLIQSALRTSAPAAILETITIADLAKQWNPVDVYLAHHNDSGNDYMHLKNADGSHGSIKISKKINLESTNDADKMSELIKGFPIYCGITNAAGETLDKPWFVFAPKATDRKTVIVSFADLMKAGKFAVA